LYKIDTGQQISNHLYKTDTGQQISNHLYKTDTGQQISNHLYETDTGQPISNHLYKIDIGQQIYNNLYKIVPTLDNNYTKDKNFHTRFPKILPPVIPGFILHFSGFVSEGKANSWIIC